MDRQKDQWKGSAIAFNAVVFLNIKYFWLRRAAKLLAGGVKAVAFFEDDGRPTCSVPDMLQTVNEQAGSSFRIYWTGYHRRGSENKVYCGSTCIIFRQAGLQRALELFMTTTRAQHADCLMAKHLRYWLPKQSLVQQFAHVSAITGAWREAPGIE